ncbi:disulfide bond formation protein B [Pacificimonas flava]|nr:disulfide bond formation protein B [Pacificimonas flava]MBB5279349.1 disulfide bond formation protein DsbB [Pacificimonas flava]
MRTAHLLVLVGPALLLGGALFGQHVFGLYPCELCMYQRWPHAAALAIGTIALLVGGAPRRAAVVLAALAVLASGAIGAFHAGVEYGWWTSPLPCTAVETGTSGDFMRDIMAAPIVRCDAAAWELFGISLAGYNAIFSFLIGGMALWLMNRNSRRRWQK